MSLVEDRTERPSSTNGVLAIVRGGRPVHAMRPPSSTVLASPRRPMLGRVCLGEAEDGCSVQLTKYLPDLFRAMGVARQAVRLSDCQHARHGYMVPRACSGFRGNGLATQDASTLPQHATSYIRLRLSNGSILQDTRPCSTSRSLCGGLDTTTTRNRCRQGESALGCHAMSLPFLGSGLGLGTLSSSNPGASQLGPIWMPRRRLWVAKGRPISPEVPIIPKHIRRPPPSPPPTPHLHRRASLGSGVRSRQVDSEPSRSPPETLVPVVPHT
ncbi:hypothetical protein BGZ61DRAFT_472208 [Ilyonectria robusta]|uniref:uncharacterized protein n=1 Tax=Ilyonectria robusta TaxID=1079257 RepID=UPI001E8E2FB4|nr:uncharacterized protein BGZ61DRAFT_472208 [Ilyonectria robusta]KAH8735816.1 hypothetical protein BGZ61DRAFT_472208 [Ilyonectria robusta]